MDIKNTDLVSLFEKALAGQPQTNLDEIGKVIQVGDGICQVHGLEKAIYNELVDFEGGNRGIILNLEQDYVTVFLLYNSITVVELEVVRRTGQVFKAPVGMELLGRTLNAMGKPIDGKGGLENLERSPIEAFAPGVIERSPVNESLETGIMAIDSLIPIGKGQRELIIGNRNTGKTALALDAILHQKGKNVLCIYVSIGQRQANLARKIRLLVENGALEYTVIVSADSADSVLCQYLAPYVGCTIGEYFRKQGRDALIVYDDLSNHAIAYREMSLLMRRPPGREAYPGDVFYLHSRLLERAGKILNGGSLTALPLVQIQSDDITAYIPTNLISITDGQIFLDDQLFKSGIRPAVNIGLSVSRVGGAAQTKAIKKTAKTLGLELAQYRELLDFSQFGTELDTNAQEQLARGQRAVEILKQAQFITYSFVQQALMLLVLQEGALDDVPVSDVHAFVTQFASYVESVYDHLYQAIEISQDLSPETHTELLVVIKEFKTLFIAPEI
ncbi:MAG: F0F1 ATP synthase subunit alpha [Candidatus Babeliales bacterium]|jgi:F-type H+-transporting ATPase subunit alpha